MIFGNSEQIRSKHYRQPDTDAEYAALGELGEKQESGSQQSKKSPPNSPLFGTFWAYIEFLMDLQKRRLTYFEICYLLMEEKGYDKKSFDKLVEENPTFSEMVTFVNSFLFKGYDDSRKVTFCSFLWDCMRIGIKIPRLMKKFRKDLKVPKEYTEELEKSTESLQDRSGRTTSFCPNSFVLLILESFLISLTIRFAIFKQNFSANRNVLSLILSDVPANFTHKKTAALSPVRPFELANERNIQ